MSDLTSYTILALDSSAGPASCAVLRRHADGNRQILASSFINMRLTHSQTLLPMVGDTLKNAGMTIEDVDILGVSVGPGSFTGIRIGVAAIKGLAFPRNIPCAGVSTLAAMARNAQDLPFSGLVLGAMDARCQQVYTALFQCQDGHLTRLAPDEALVLDQLADRLKNQEDFAGKSILVVGDGAQLCYNTLKGAVPGLRLMPESLRYQQGIGVALEAASLADSGSLVPAERLLPVYLRLPQAERELKRRRETENHKPGIE